MEMSSDNFYTLEEKKRNTEVQWTSMDFNGLKSFDAIPENARASGPQKLFHNMMMTRKICHSSPTLWFQMFWKKP
jgi:hypothetical protein